MNKFKKNTSKDPVGPSALMLLEDCGLFEKDKSLLMGPEKEGVGRGGE